MNRDRVLLSNNIALKNKWERAGHLGRIKDQSCRDCGNPSYRFWYPMTYELTALSQVFPVCKVCYYERKFKADSRLENIYQSIKRNGRTVVADIAKDIQHHFGGYSTAVSTIRNLIPVLEECGRVIKMKDGRKSYYQIVQNEHNE